LTRASDKQGGGAFNRKTVYKVPIDYDRTPHKEMARWDERILDEDVARIIKMVYMPVPDKNFARSDCSTVGTHFSPPYSKVAKEMFGYEELERSRGLFRGPK
jgi:hypothetical protein